ncbi:MAG: VWA domain-containing protein [Bryobacterales bacterium]|nr:VWA domain-containing protein [Bryobacterales bacterium]
MPVRAILGLFLAVSLLAAAPPALPKRQKVRIPVWVPAGVSAPAFEARLDGQPARVLSVSKPDDDLLILLVLDLAGDIALVNPAKEAIKAQIRALPEPAYVGVIRAQDGMDVLLDPTADRDPVIDAIDALAPTGKAGTLEALEPVARIANTILEKTSVRVAVLFVTDSDIYNYRDDYTNPVINRSDSRDLSRQFPEALIQDKVNRLSTKLGPLQAPMFILHLNYRSDRLNEAYQVGLQRLASTTGAASYFCRSLPEIPANIESSFASMLSHYSVSLELPEKLGRSARVELSLGENDGSGLSYRDSFIP